MGQPCAEPCATIKGVAGRTVARLMAELPEIGIFSNKAIAKLVGLAPIANDSGKQKGQRQIRGGRAGVRSILFLVADIAARYDPNLADFQRRLAEAGKEKMVIRIALARKLLVSLNAKARDARAELRKCNLTPQIVAHPRPLPASAARGQTSPFIEMRGHWMTDKKPLLSVEDALAVILDSIQPLGVENVPLSRGLRPHARPRSRRPSHPAAQTLVSHGRLRVARRRRRISLKIIGEFLRRRRL